MPEIGPTLQDARMRAGIDVAEVELATKIRAKYLRALENEEWALLPGPTFVRSFLRTYADYLGLDSKLLIEEYRRSHEGYTELELHPAAAHSSVGTQRRRPPGRRFALTRAWIAGFSLLGAVAALLLLGLLGGSDPERPTPPPVALKSPSGASGTAGIQTTPRRRPPAPSTAPADRVRLSIEPTADVWVCLVNAAGKRVVPGTVLTPGAKEVAKPFLGKSFTMTFGNGNVRLKVDGKAFAVPKRPDPVGYRIGPSGRKELAKTDLPTCA